MAKKLNLFLALLIVSGMSLILPFQSGASQTIGEKNVTEGTSPLGDNNMSNASAASGNNTIILNPAEVDEEQYKWINNAGEDNPNLNIISDIEYTIKIDNPTDEEHELIITSKSDGKTNAIAESPEIEPGKNGEFKFKAEQIGELGYHCEYHPDQMNGTIGVTEFSY